MWIALNIVGFLLVFSWLFLLSCWVYYTQQWNVRHITSLDRRTYTLEEQKSPTKSHRTMHG